MTSLRRYSGESVALVDDRRRGEAIWGILLAMDVRLGDDALVEAVTAAREAQDSLAATRSRAGSRVDALLAEGWTGRAATAFAEAWQEWLAGAASVSCRLAVLGEALAAADRELTGTDLAAADLSAQVRDRLG